VAGATAVSGTAAAAEKRGGRAQINDDEGGDDVRRDEPFTVEMTGTVPRDASCKSEQSAMQTYVAYEVTYCDMEMNMDDDQVMIYVLPDEAQLVSTEVYDPLDRFLSRERLRSHLVRPVERVLPDVTAA
jgi:hypothetical protein